MVTGEQYGNMFIMFLTVFLEQILLLMLQCNILISLDKDKSILFLSACPKLDIGMYNKEIVSISYVQYPLPPH